MITLPSSRSSCAWLGENFQFTLRPQEENKQTNKKTQRNVHVVCQLWGAVQGTGFCLAWHGMLTESAYSVCLGATENKELGDLLQQQRTCSTTNRHQREQEITSSWKRKRQTSLIGKIYTHTQRCITRKVWEAPTSLAELIGEDLPLYKASP